MQLMRFAGELAAGLASEIRRRNEPDVPALSPREREVLKLIAGGSSIPAMAKELFLAPSTVKTHVQRLYEKLGVNDRLMAVSVARQVGLLSFVSPTARTTVVAQPRHPEPVPVPTTVADVRGQRAVAWRPGGGAILFDPAP